MTYCKIALESTKIKHIPISDRSELGVYYIIVYPFGLHYKLQLRAF